MDNDAIRQRLVYIIDEAAGSVSRAEIARRIGMDPSNLSKHLTGRLPVSDALINRMVVELGVSKSWLTEGRGVPFEKFSPETVVAVGDVASNQRGIPVYDVDVTAGCRPLERLLTDDNIAGYVDLPRINPECVLVRVNGESMEPQIIDGGFVAIRPVRTKSAIFWGQIYVVMMEDYRMVKILRRHPSDSQMVILHSVNPDFDDMEVARTDIQALFLVESILNVRNLC